MEFEQDEPPYFPGEEGNNPFERSKFALAHIWHEVSPRICASTGCAGFWSICASIESVQAKLASCQALPLCLVKSDKPGCASGCPCLCL